MLVIIPCYNTAKLIAISMEVYSESISWCVYYMAVAASDFGREGTMRELRAFITTQ